MCGIVGLFFKHDRVRHKLGPLLGKMLTEMTDRGPDSTGFAAPVTASGRCLPARSDRRTCERSLSLPASRKRLPDSTLTISYGASSSGRHPPSDFASSSAGQRDPSISCTR